MSVLKKLTKAISKPVKEVGKAIHWTDIRYPVVGAAVGALTGGVGSAVIGALGGNMVGGAYQQNKIQKDMMSAEQAAAEAAAQQQYNASLQPIATPAAVDGSAIADSNYSADRKRRFSLSRTTMQKASLLGSSSTGRTTLG